MEHDGEANHCADDVPLGSIMSPRVQATFHRYHWSRCSWMELHKYLHSYDCLRDDPFNHDWPAQPQLPGFHYSMDQQCRFDFGPGYSLCTAYATSDPCKQLWCSDYLNPFYCKTKKGPPLDGTSCGPGKNCFKGFCMTLTPDLLRQDGGWGTWSSYGACSRTCGGGVRYRTRRCDNPEPANGGRTCLGNSFEFQLCSHGDCPPMTDFREDQCKAWNPVLEHEGMKHHWLPYQHPDLDERCRLYCRSKETSSVVFMDRLVHDGTPCSYGDAYSVCVRGDCEYVGCDGQIASDQQEDRCGVCGGDNSSCKVVKGNFTRSTKKQGYLKILEIPKGARHLLFQEFKGSPHVLALKNQDTGQIFLNDEDQTSESRGVVEGGVAWDYSNEGEEESIQTTGPLNYRVQLMVRSHGDSKVTVSYRYIIRDGLRSELESNLVQEEAVFYEWALKKWSHCSKPCGGGRQYTRFGCRRKADGKMVPRTFCSSINKPRAISRACNTEACRSPRWVSGDWGDCSASCGQTGWQRRWVSCQQESSRGQQRSVNTKLCTDQKPDAKRSCNRFPCPSFWRTGPWTPCSVSCGNGTQERHVVCSSPEGAAGNCSKAQPITMRICQAPPCNGDQKNAIILWLSRSNPDFPAPKISSRQRCRGDRSVFCRMEVLSRYCSIPGYWQMCCRSCSEANSSSVAMTTVGSGPLTSAPESFSTWPEGSGDAIDDVISTPPPHFTVTPPPTTGASSDFVYVDYDDYFSYEGDASTAPPPDTPPTIAPAAVPMVTVDSGTQSRTPAEPDGVFTATTPGGWSLQSAANQTEAGPVAPPLTLVPLPRKENNSVDEVSYRVVGLDADVAKGHQNYFVPRMPPFRERTQNKRIQQLLNEKRRQDLLRRPRRTDKD